MASATPSPSSPAPNAAPVPFIDLTRQHQAIAADVMSAIEPIFTDQSFVLGQAVADFESEVAGYCDAVHAIGCASGTDALVLSLMAAGIGMGDEVITSPFTFFATAGAIHRVGAVPVFVDIDPVTFNLDAAQVESVITSQTAAIMPVHIFGQCCEMEPIWRAAVKHGLAIIEDAAQAIGASYRGRKAGVLGTTGCFSFFPTKNLGGAGDGGMITTDDPELDRRLRSLRVHGQSGTYMHREVGLNSRLDALQAAVLSVKLKQLESWADARRRHAARYEQLFAEHKVGDALTLPTASEGQGHVYNQYTVRVNEHDRDAVMQELRSRGIGCNVYYPVPIHLQECFAYLSCSEGAYPESERASKSVLSLPIFPEMREDEQDRVVANLADVLQQGTGSQSLSKAA